MKSSSALIIAAVFCCMAPGIARAQTSAPLPVSSGRTTVPRSSEKNSSWLFVVETKTQWLLLIQDGSDSSNSTSSGVGLGTGSSNSSASGPRAGNSMGGSTTVSGGGGGANGSNAGKPDGTGEKPGTQIDSFVLEGNTNDLPLLVEPSNTPKPSTSPS